MDDEVEMTLIAQQHSGGVVELAARSFYFDERENSDGDETSNDHESYDGSSGPTTRSVNKNIIVA